MYTSSEVTEEGVLALAAHCRQLQEIHLSRTTLTDEAIRKLVLHCRHLTALYVRVNVREGAEMVELGKQYSSKDIRALREQARGSVPAAEVIAHHNNKTCCLIL